MRGTRKIALAAVVLAGGAVVAVSGVAAAEPTNCTSSLSGKTTTATCTSGTGTFRAYIECLTHKPGDPIEVIRYGAYVSPGQSSRVGCANTQTVLDYGIQKRN